MIIAIAEEHVVERLQRGLEGYERIVRHALSADASAQIVAEADAPEKNSTSTEEDPAGSGGEPQRQAGGMLMRSRSPRTVALRKDGRHECCDL